MGNKVLVRGFYDSVRGHVTVLTFILTFLANKKKTTRLGVLGVYQKVLSVQTEK